MSARLLLAAAWLKPAPQGRGADAVRAGGAGRLDLASTRPGSRRFQGRVRAWGPFLPSPVGRAPVLLLLAVVVAFAVMTPVRAQATQTEGPAESRTANPPSTPARIGGEASGLCVQVDVGGYRTGHLDCASRALQQAARLAQSQARSTLDAPRLQAGSPDVSVGVSSLSGSRLRMGDALGVSVHPQRPVRAFGHPRTVAPPEGQP